MIIYCNPTNQKYIVGKLTIPAWCSRNYRAYYKTVFIKIVISIIIIYSRSNTQDIFYSANGEPQMESMENVADSETVDHQLVNLILNDPRVRLIKNLRMIQRFGLEVHRSKILGPVDPSMRIQELNFWDFQKFRYESYEISPRPIPNASHV